MTTSPQTQQQTAANWIPPSNQLESRPFDVAEPVEADALNPFQSRPFAAPSDSPEELPDVQARLGNNQPKPSLFDFTQTNLFAGGLPNSSSPAPAIQRHEKSRLESDLEDDSEESGQSIQRKCDACADDEEGDKPPDDIQPKLTIGQPGDKYEQEADQVAAQVVEQINAPDAQQSVATRQAEVQREESDEKNELHMKPMAVVQRMGEENEELQRKPELLRKEETEEKAVDANDGLESAIQQSRGGGQPLAESIRQPIEQAFGGVDFSGVKVHTDAQSDQLNRSIQAKAFTTGQDIYFRSGEYEPGSRGGQELLAHELTHVVQQTGGGIQAQAKSNRVQMKLARSPLPGLTAFNLLQRRQDQDGASVESDVNGASGTGSAAEPATNRDQATSPVTGEAATSDSSPASGEASTASANAPAPTASPGESVDSSPGENGAATPEAAALNETTSPGEQTSSDTSGSDGGGSVGGGAASEGAGGGAAPEGSTTTPATPEEDPGFQAVASAVGGVAAEEQTHNPAESDAAAAQAAAQSPTNEVESQAQHQQAGVMEQQEPGTFNAEAFKAALLEKIEQIIPDTEEEAKDFGDNNELDSVRQEVSSQTSEEQEAAAGPIRETTEAEPDTSQIEPRTSTPLEPQPIGTATTEVGAERAAPPPRPETEVSAPLEANVQDIDQQMADANVTEEQLANSNEPEFQGALTAREEVSTHATAAPATYRQQEQGIITQTQTDAQSVSQQELGAMHGDRERLLSEVGGQQEQTQTQDESERAKIAGHINGIYEKTKSDVEILLNGLDEEVTGKFDTAAADAKQVFENYVKTEMEKWEDERYGEFYDVTGWDERLSDAWHGLPPDVNKIFVKGKQEYIDKMDVALTDIATHVATKLNEAKERITQGRQEIQEYVTSLPQSLQEFGQQSAQNIQAQFDELENSVNSKQDELIDSLAQRYSDSLGEVNARIEEMKEANRGLKDKAMDAMGGAIQTILELKNMLMGVLARAAGAIENIITDPIGFLENLVTGLKQGFDNFVANIWEHLKKGLVGWLTGALAGAGIQIPETFDLMGIFKLVMQVLGLAYEAIKSRTVRALGANGERIFNALETSFDIFIILKNEGIGGLWQFIQDKIGDLQVMVLDTIQNFVIETVIKQGVLWVLSLLNPASAFVKACKMIYDVIMFFVERGSQILDLVNAVMDSVTSIASGALSVAANLVEGALSKALPVVISFMASLLGLGGISDKVREIIEQVKAPIDQAIDWIIAQAVKFAKKIGKALGFGKDVEDGNSREQTAEGEGEELEDSEVGERVNFNAGGEGHRLWIRTQGLNTEVMVASDNPGPVEAKLNDWQSRLDSLSEEDRPRAQTLLATARQQFGTTEQSAQQTAREMQEAQQDSANEAAIDEAEAADNQTEAKEQTLSNTLQKLFELFGEETENREISRSELFERARKLNKRANDLAKKFNEQDNSELNHIQEDGDEILTTPEASAAKSQVFSLLLDENTRKLQKTEQELVLKYETKLQVLKDLARRLKNRVYEVIDETGQHENHDLSRIAQESEYIEKQINEDNSNPETLRNHEYELEQHNNRLSEIEAELGLKSPFEFIQEAEPGIFKLKAEYHSIWRDKFYKCRYSNATYTEMEKLRITPRSKGGWAHETNPSLIWDVVNQEFVSASTDNHQITVDHTPEAVVDHWNSEGHNMGQAGRHQWYRDGSNHKYVLKKHNSSDGAKKSGSFDPKVGEFFSGPGGKK